MSRDTKIIIGTWLAAMSFVGGVVSVQISAQFGGLLASLDALRDEMGETRPTIQRLDSRLDAVEVAIGKLDQRLLTIERVVLPSASTSD